MILAHLKNHYFQWQDEKRILLELVKHGMTFSSKKAAVGGPTIMDVNTGAASLSAAALLCRRCCYTCFFFALADRICERPVPDGEHVRAEKQDQPGWSRGARTIHPAAARDLQRGPFLPTLARAGKGRSSERQHCERCAC